MNGAATNPILVVSYAGSQVKNAIDATIKLKGENYILGWKRYSFVEY